MISIVGAGSVGLAVGARLARSGEQVRFVTRRESAARALRERGVRLEDPATGEAWSARVEAIAGIRCAGPRLEEGPILICVRANETASVAEELARVAPAGFVASVQNDVDNPEILASCFSRVAGCAYRQTCTRKSETEALAIGWGRIVLGAWPEGRTADVDALAECFRNAGYDVGVSSRIASDLWLKLCVNLMSAPNALVAREDHTHPAFVEVKARLLEEARDVLAAARIEASSCDGRDRSLDAEIGFQRASIARGESARKLPVYNQVWSALRHGGPLEADRYHRRILDLAESARLPAPQNRRVLEVLLDAYESRRGPELVRAARLLAGT